MQFRLELLDGFISLQALTMSFKLTCHEAFFPHNSFLGGF